MTVFFQTHKNKYMTLNKTKKIFTNNFSSVNWNSALCTNENLKENINIKSFKNTLKFYDVNYPHNNETNMVKPS